MGGSSEADAGVISSVSGDEWVRDVREPLLASDFFRQQARSSVAWEPAAGTATLETSTAGAAATVAHWGSPALTPTAAAASDPETANLDMLLGSSAAGPRLLGSDLGPGLGVAEGAWQGAEVGRFRSGPPSLASSDYRD